MPFHVKLNGTSLDLEMPVISYETIALMVAKREPIVTWMTSDGTVGALLPGNTVRLSQGLMIEAREV